MTKTLWMTFLSVALTMPAHAEDAKLPDPIELLTRQDDLFRGKSSRAKITMKVKTRHWERKLTLESWAKGTQKSLIRILSPAKERGVSTLKVDDNLWNYLPKVNRVIKVPASMMSGSWMGSHFTNDDLVQESRLSEDYDISLEKKDDLYVLTLVPKPDAAIVWGKVVSRIRISDELPKDVVYYDEKGKVVRTMTYEDIREIGGHRVPVTMRLVPADKPEEYTVITYEELDLDADVPDSKFTLQSLKR